MAPSSMSSNHAANLQILTIEHLDIQASKLSNIWTSK